MTEQTPSNDPYESGNRGCGYILAIGNALAGLALVGGGVYVAYGYIKNEEYPAFDPERTAVITDTTHLPARPGNIILVPGPGGVPVMPLSSPSREEACYLSVEQPVHNLDGDTATAVGSIQVDCNQLNKFEPGQLVVPADVDGDFRQLATRE